MSFRYQDPTLETSWRSIILLGRNVASYKFALAKTLLQIENKDSLLLLNLSNVTSITSNSGMIRGLIDKV